MSQGNAELLRRLFEAVARRDAGTVLALYHPDIDWDGTRSRWGEVMPGEARWRGHDGLRRFFRMYYEMWEDLQDEPVEMIEAGEHVVAIVNSRARGRASGAVVEWGEHASVWTFRDGKVIRVVWLPTRAEALEMAGLGS